MTHRRLTKGRQRLPQMYKVPTTLESCPASPRSWKLSLSVFLPHMSPFSVPFFTCFDKYRVEPGPTRRYVLDGQLDGTRQGVYCMSACSNGSLLAIGGELLTHSF